MNELRYTVAIQDAGFIGEWVDQAALQSHDFESARQWSWALLNLWQELASEKDAVSAQQRTAAQPCFDDLSSMLQLNLASVSAADQVQGQLLAAHNFRLDAYQAQLKTLRTALNSP